MEREIAVSLITGFTIFNLVGTIVILSLSLFYTVLFLRKSVWTEYSWIKLILAVMEFVFIGVYIYELIHLLTTGIDLASPFGITIMRPLFLGLCICLLFAARARYNTLIHGGEKWLLKKSKES